jgi:hypothetical protein
MIPAMTTFNLRNFVMIENVTNSSENWNDFWNNEAEQTTMNSEIRNFFTDDEWDIIVWALEQESMLQPEQEWEKYGMIIDKINTLLQYDKHRSSD